MTMSVTIPSASSHIGSSCVGCAGVQVCLPRVEWDRGHPSPGDRVMNSPWCTALTPQHLVCRTPTLARPPHRLLDREGDPYHSRSSIASCTTCLRTARRGPHSVNEVYPISTVRGAHVQTSVLVWSMRSSAGTMCWADSVSSLFHPDGCLTRASPALRQTARVGPGRRGR
jgi:hypothetical protein